MAVANENQGKPIVFIAVNSGNSAAQVASYLKKNNVTWPTIVDSTRRFEAAAGVGEISLKNIAQDRTINAKGEWGNTSGALKQIVDKLLIDAKWNVDPATIPPALQEAWFSVEFGNYGAAAKMLKKSVGSRKEDISTAAQILSDYVEQKLDEQLEIAAKAKESENLWLAYKTYLNIDRQFDGYENEVDLSAILDELKDEPTVKDEIAAQKLLESASRQMAKSGMKRAAGMLQKITEKHPGTEAADQALAILGSVEE